MALAFKRSRMDVAEGRTFPNAKEEVIFRPDVSNRNLLKNPWRTATEVVGQAGVMNRTPMKIVDDRGAVYATSLAAMRDDVTNKNLLHNPYNFKTDPAEERRTLSMQVIKDINSGNAPRFIRENKGIDQIAFIILQNMPNDGVKLVTISMLKSQITGRRLNSTIDQGGQKVSRSFDVLKQLLSTATGLYKNGLLDTKIHGLLLDYSKEIGSIYGETIYQVVLPGTMFAAIQDLASISTVLTKLFASQNNISPPTNVNIDDWVKMENIRLKAIREGEMKQDIKNEIDLKGSTGENQPTGTQGIKDADNIKQEGSGVLKYKKNVYGGKRISRNIADSRDSKISSIPENKPTPQQAINIYPDIKVSPIVNVSPQEPISVNITNKKPFPYDTVLSGIGTALSAAALAYTINANSAASRREGERDRDKSQLRRAIATEYLGLQRSYKNVFDKFWGDDSDMNLSPRELSASGFHQVDISDILMEDSKDKRLYKLLMKILEYQDQGMPLTVSYYDASLLEPRTPPDTGPLEAGHDRSPLRSGASDAGSTTASQRAAAMRAKWAKKPLQFEEPVIAKSFQDARGRGKKSKSKKSKSKSKKSKNLDAQILSLLKA